MATDTLTLPIVAEQVNVQWQRLQMLDELCEMAIDSLPSNTDSDKTSALLNGMKSMIREDMEKINDLFEGLSAWVDDKLEVSHVA